MRTSAISAGLSVVSALLDLALPTTCAACDGAAKGPLCEACSTNLRATLFDHPRRVRPDPVPPQLPPVVSCGPYAGVVRALVTAYKDNDRRDLRPGLAALLREALEVTVDGLPGPARGSLLLVPVPSSRTAVRQRGDEPVTDLVRAAARGLPLPAGLVAACLRPVRRLADQSRLGHRERAANLDGAYAVRPRWEALVHGSTVVLVDDVVTTGATLAEAARAVRAAGGHVAAAATLAATRRRTSPVRCCSASSGKALPS